MPTGRGLLGRLSRLEAVAAARAARQPDYSRYRNDPIGYAAKVLRVSWWAKQREIALALTRPPYKVLVKASHSVGKSHVAGGLVNWWFDTRKPGICVTTAPKFDQVRDVLWKEVRLQRRGRPGFVGTKLPRLETAPDHYAVGATAERAEGFQGQHGPAVLFMLDEAVGVPRYIWQAADSLMMGVEYGLLAICNPTDPASEFYAREQTGNYTVIEISCLDHPNIAAELRGEDPPYPAAVRLAWLEERLSEWCSPVVSDPLPTDIEWPPGSGKYLRPGPLAEARLLGRWPSAAAGVWSDVLWAAAESCPATFDPADLPEIGCDVARFGDDNTEFHVRVGPRSLHHEARNGWDNVQVIGRLRQLCREWAGWATARRPPRSGAVRPQDVRCKVDDDGMGGRVTDHADGYDWQPVVAASTAHDPEYPNVRSELWFATAERAKAGRLSLASLDAKTRRELKRQAMAPTYKLDAAGRRVVEPKEKTKAELGRSPDSIDALNLAYYEVGGSEVASWIGGEPERRSVRDRFRR